MSTDRLREAAHVLRERAEAARAGKWSSSGADVMAERTWGYATVTSTRGNAATVEGDVANALYIAMMHPRLALALADWLDYEAYLAEWEYQTPPAALHIADLILGLTS